jgi:aminoglycoside 6'-N-acetyltransferase I
LWPQDEAVQRGEMERMLAEPTRFRAFLAFANGRACGFAEASIRSDYVDGCETSPVVFLEGVYVEESERRRGFARALCAAVAAWGRDRGCTEFASNALLDNTASHAMHRALGFEETERVVFFRAPL